MNKLFGPLHAVWGVFVTIPNLRLTLSRVLPGFNLLVANVKPSGYQDGYWVAKVNPLRVPRPF
jgi:hypothetical protein